ncbi:MAG TPA: hypothetical protein VJU15_13380 [Gemmatimonadales bacterium]|nr:hypothetical protein [Gemmatimonadales bacterium]
MIVARDPDTRFYVRECLRELTSLRLFEAATIGPGLGLHVQPELLIVDGTAGENLPMLPVIHLADDAVDMAGVIGARHAVLIRPFSAHALVALVKEFLEFQPLSPRSTEVIDSAHQRR